MDPVNMKKLADFKERMAQEREFKMRSSPRKTHYVKKRKDSATDRRIRRAGRGG